MDGGNKWKFFSDPPNMYRAKPFWAWNGELKEDELKRQILVMKEMGFGGYFMHSRIGLITEYLGDEWFRLVNACADYGAAQGLESWIYDEDRWPSGSAGGVAVKDRANRMKHIRMNVGAVDKKAHVIGVFTCRLDGKNVYDVSPLGGEYPPDKDVIWFEVITRPDNSSYNGAAYLDTMKREATQAFLNSTHERYARNCGQRLGASIKGIFTDEPHRGELLIDVVREGLDFTACIPYTDTLFEAFRRDWGYDLRDKLPAVFLRENGERVSRVKWQYCETLQRLFIENHIKPVSAWCRQHGMIYTGHMLHEDSLSAQTLMNGSLMRCYEHMEYPGVDLLGSANVNYNVVKQVTSVANQCGKKHILSEMYGATGWEMTLKDYKRIGDWQAILGIDLRCPHLSWYTMTGERKRDYPASIFFQSAWYREYKHLEDYYARLAVFMSQGVPVRDVLVINPVESMWCSYYVGWAEWLITKDKDCLAVEKAYTELAQFLLENDVAYDYGDEEMLSRMARVENDLLIVGHAAYQQVIVPKMLTIRSSTVALLEQFQRSGGKVIVYEDIPRYVDAERQDAAIGNAGMESVLRARRLAVKDRRILSSLRKAEDGTYYVMLLNTDSENAVSAVWHMPPGSVKQWDPETGKTAGAAREERVVLQPGEMRLLSVGREQRELAVQENLPQVKLKEPFHYMTGEPNVLVIDKAVCSMNGRKLTGDVLKLDRAIRRMLGLPIRGGEMLQPWYNAKRAAASFGMFELQYSFDSSIACQAFLATETSGSIQMNGESICLSEDWWVDPCFRKAPIMIRKGRNVVTIQDVWTERQNLEAIYILGEFGVWDGVIGKKPDRIAPGDITGQGFPHYSGKITYIFEQPIRERSVLQFRDLCGAAAIRVNQRILAWPPYCVEVEPCDRVEIELSLTRRNTFGPLHRLPAADTVCSPESFVTDGERWTDEMVVLPCGLTIPS